MKLDEFQKAFTRAIIHPESLEAKELLASQINELGILNNLESIEVYQSNHVGSLNSVLEEIYSTTKTLLGEEVFGTLAQSYIGENPAKVADLNLYGETFSSFIENEFDELDFISGVAQIDWARHKAFYAKETKSTIQAKINKIVDSDPSTVLFELNPSLSLIVSEYPIKDIWDSCQAESKEMYKPIIEGYGVVAVWRRGYDVCIENLTKEQGTLFTGIQKSVCYEGIVNEYFSGNIEGFSVELLNGIQKNLIVDIKIIER